MNNKAFTLIELLVVVIIIAILAAIAVSQYQKAVFKSRAMSGIAIGKVMMDAMDMYYLDNGEFKGRPDKFIISLPPGAQNEDGSPMTSLPTAFNKPIYYNVGNGPTMQFEFQSGGRLQFKLKSNPELNIYFCSRSAIQQNTKTYQKCYQLAGKITCTYGNNKEKAQCERLGAKYLKTGTYVF